MKTPKRPNPDALNFWIVMTLTFSVGAALLLPFTSQGVGVAEFVVAVFALFGWREIRLYDRYMHTAEAPQEEAITHP